MGAETERDDAERLCEFDNSNHSYETVIFLALRIECSLKEVHLKLYSHDQ